MPRDHLQANNGSARSDASATHRKPSSPWTAQRRANPSIYLLLCCGASTTFLFICFQCSNLNIIHFNSKLLWLALLTKGRGDPAILNTVRYSANRPLQISPETLLFGPASFQRVTKAIMAPRISLRVPGRCMAVTLTLFVILSPSLQSSSPTLCAIATSCIVCPMPISHRVPVLTCLFNKAPLSF